VVNRVDGTVVEVRQPLVAESSGDRLTDALQAHKEHRNKVASLFSSSLADVAKKEQERKDVFEESLRRAREMNDDEAPPLRDIDLD